MQSSSLHGYFKYFAANVLYKLFPVFSKGVQLLNALLRQIWSTVVEMTCHETNPHEPLRPLPSFLSSLALSLSSARCTPHHVGAHFIYIDLWRTLLKPMYPLLTNSNLRVYPFYTI